MADVRGQLILTAPAETFVQRVVWKGDVAGAWRPHEDERSPVLIDPELRFGKPSVQGISTEVIWEHDDDGADTQEIADDFGLELDDVRWALAYELSQRAACTVGSPGRSPLLLRRRPPWPGPDAVPSAL